ncbi:MAG: T9SS type A sorting domain-containing protein [Flavobacteriales bacterium]|nr:T9SS type A sorting domain-containing protein [Flavobacteriales bacterium]
MVSRYTLALPLMGLALAATAQSVIRPISQPSTYSKHTPVSTPIARAKGGPIFSEDFANGLTGNNGVGAWTTSGPDATVWAFDTDGPSGDLANSDDDFGSTTLANGFMIFDVNLSNNGCDDINIPCVGRKGYLESPVLDLTATPFVTLSFEHMFRHCCNFEFEPYVDISTDGGGSYPNRISVLDGLERNDRMPTTLKELPLGAYIVGAPSNVRIRFGWEGDAADANGQYATHYYWTVDDISLTLTPQNDLKCNEGFLAQTNVSYDDLVARNLEYTINTLEQSSPLIVGATVLNNGSAAQPNVTVAATITQNGTVVGTYTSAPYPVLAPNQLDSIYIVTGWTPNQVGNVEVSLSVSSDSTDVDVSDNTADRSFRTTGPSGPEGWNTMGHDAGLNSGEFFRIGTNQTLQAIGHKYEIDNAGSLAYGLSTFFVDGTTLGALVTAELYTDDGTDLTLMAASDLFTIESFHLSGAGDSVPVFIPFDAIASDPNPIPLALDPALDYWALISNGGSDTVNIATNGSVARGGLVSLVTASGQLTQYVGEGNPAVLVRLVMAPNDVSVPEIAGATATLGQNMPNPAHLSTAISFELERSAKTTLEVRDMSGKLVRTLNLGDRGTGTHRVTLNTADLMSGVYFYTLQAGGDRQSRRMVVMH